MLNSFDPGQAGSDLGQSFYLQKLSADGKSLQQQGKSLTCTQWYYTEIFSDLYSSLTRNSAKNVLFTPYDVESGSRPIFFYSTHEYV